MGRLTRCIVSLGGAVAVVAAATVITGAGTETAGAVGRVAGAGATGITAGQAVGVPPGDYLLTVTGLTATATTYGQIGQKLNGQGSIQRDADFLASTTPTTVTAEVRVASGNDTFTPITYSASASWTSITLAAASWSYLARGAQITSPTSANVLWHGVNAIPDMGHQDYVNLASAYPRAKFVRVMVDEGCWDPFFVAAQTTSFCRQLGGSARYQANVKAAVADIVAHGQVAMLLANDAGRDNPNWYVKVIGDDFGPDQHTLALYHALDQLYGNNAQVIFETTNEPKMVVGQHYQPNNIEGGALWLNGGTVTVDNITWNAPGVQQIVDQIRADGAGNLVLAEGSSWGENLVTVEGTPVVGTNIGYSYHGYRDPDNQPTYPPTWDSQIAPVIGPNSTYHYAGLLSEFGTTQKDALPPVLIAASQYLQSCITWTVNHGMGWAAWGWYPDTWGDPFAIVHTYQPLTLNSKGTTVAKNF